MLLEYSLLDFDLATGRYHMNDLVRSHALHKALAADPHAVEALRGRFVQYYLGQLKTCRALLAQQQQNDGTPDKERATLLFTRERYNLDACSKFLQQSPSLGQGTLGQEFIENFQAVCHGLNATTTPASLQVAEPAANTSAQEEHGHGMEVV
jgi:hypothetical protein